MRPDPIGLAGLAIVVALGCPTVAQAQDVLGGAQGGSVLSGSPPPAAARPSPAPDADAPDQPPKPAYTPTPAPPAPTWLPRQAAVLQALDKLDGQSATLTIPVGQTQNWRKLGITVRSCFARPPDQPQDATAFLVIAGGADTPGFTGWMLAAEPAASMMEHPVYDVRVLGCR